MSVIQSAHHFFQCAPPSAGSRNLGGSVVYSHALTSPSYGGRALGGAGAASVRHVLGLAAPFPPPEFVLASPAAWAKVRGARVALPPGPRQG